MLLSAKYFLLFSAHSVILHHRIFSSYRTRIYRYFLVCLCLRLFHKIQRTNTRFNDPIKKIAKEIQIGYNIK